MTPQTAFAGGVNPFARPAPKPASPPRQRKSRALPERRPPAAPMQDKIVDWIAKHPEATSADVMSAMHIQETNCLKQLRTLTARGRIVRTMQVSGSSHWYTYIATGTRIPLAAKVALDVVYSIKVTDKQRKALAVLGGGKWLRQRINEAMNDPQAKQ